MKRAELDTYPVAYVEGLLARVAELEARCKRLEELRSKLEEEQEAHAWEISPAMAQAKIDELNAKVSTLEANGLELERTRLAARVAELEADSKRLDWLLRRGVAWRGCYNDWWLEGEWLHEKGKPRDIIDEAMEAKP